MSIRIKSASFWRILSLFASLCHPTLFASAEASFFVAFSGYVSLVSTYLWIMLNSLMDDIRQKGEILCTKLYIV